MIGEMDASSLGRVTILEFVATKSPCFYVVNALLIFLLGEYTTGIHIPFTFTGIKYGSFL